MTLKEYRELKNAINKMVMEAFEIENFDFEDSSEKHDKKDKKKRKKHKDSEKHTKKSNDSGNNNSSMRNKRSIVLKWLQDDKLDNAEIMRELWHPNPEDEDTKRSYFYKCRDGELNDAGNPYSFTDEDITSLYKIRANSRK